ncbi:hypothetical protein K458DRAFT_290325, partial [Lentithecium fluviatile CBS 122367]
PTNYIHAHLRPRGPNTRPTLISITQSLTQIWNSLLQPTKPGSLDDPRALHNVFLMEDIAAGAEQGFVLPLAGEDAQWAEENMQEFRRRAEDGEEGMRRLVEEVGRSTS